MGSTADLIGNAVRCRSAGGNRLYTQGFWVRAEDSNDLNRVGVALDRSPPEVVSTAVELLVGVDAYDRSRLLWIRETVAIPHSDAWAEIAGDRIVPCFARLTPEALAALTSCARRHGACLDVAAIAAVRTIAAVHHFVKGGFTLSLAEPVRLAASIRLRSSISSSAA